MPKTPKGAKRPADVISNAVHVMRIATGEIEEQPPRLWDMADIVAMIERAEAPVPALNVNA